MFSTVATIAMLAAGSYRKLNFLIWMPLGLLIVYCLLGNTFFFGASIVELDISELVFSFLPEDIIYRTDLVMGLGSFCFGIGMICGYRRIIFLDRGTANADPQLLRALRRFSWVAGSLCIVIIGAWMRFRDVGSVESVRLSMITAGFWPFIVAFFGWTMPFIGVYVGLNYAGHPCAKRIRPGMALTIAVVALILSVSIGFRTYFILIVIVILAAYSTCRSIDFRLLLLAVTLSIGAFLVVTYVRVEGGGGEELLLSVFKRLSLETVGAANIVFRVIDAEGIFLGNTLLMDLASKMPGRQETFGGMLGSEAGFDEGLTLTPSGILEVHANFGWAGYPLLFGLGYFLSAKICGERKGTYFVTCRRIVFLMFALDFVMGGSAAFFDFLVRLLLLNVFAKVRL